MFRIVGSIKKQELIKRQEQENARKFNQIIKVANSIMEEDECYRRQMEMKRSEQELLEK